MWSRLELHAGQLPYYRDAFNCPQGFRNLCRSRMVFPEFEHAMVDDDLVCWTGSVDFVDSLSSA